MNISDKIKFLEKKADYIRNEIGRVCIKNNAGHIAPSLSCVDVLVALYYDFMNYSPENPLSETRDRLVFSKAHGCYGLYAILCDLGIIPKKEWEKFYCREGSLKGCVERKPEYGLEAGCGSLGHGLPIAAGLALGAKLQGSSYRVFCIIGDGEMQEGTTWESLQFAVRHELSNMIVIVDANRLQAMDALVNIMDKKENECLRRLEGFGLKPVECDGHDMEKLADCLKSTVLLKENLPRVILANTVKGHGLSCMENLPKFHFRLPACKDLRAEKGTYEK